MIEGVSVRCTVGGVELLRSSRIVLSYKRRAVLSSLVITVPDPFGDVRLNIAMGDAVALRFGYRREKKLWHEWTGTLDSIDQPPSKSGEENALILRCVGMEKALSTTFVTESFYGESAKVVARRLLSMTGLAVSNVNIPDEILPHQVFSHVSVARAIKQLDMTLSTSFGHDLSAHASWLGPNGLTWSAGDEEGDVYTIATAENLLVHTPPVGKGTGVITSVLLPNLIASRRIQIRDVRRGVYGSFRALEVVHTLSAKGNTSTITYGKEQGWG
ncbi:MAG: hypothetical protein R3Y11_07595 [Pseudomonadota bacterium]